MYSFRLFALSFLIALAAIGAAAQSGPTPVPTPPFSKAERTILARSVDPEENYNSWREAWPSLKTLPPGETFLSLTQRFNIALPRVNLYSSFSMRGEYGLSDKQQSRYAWNSAEANFDIVCYSSAPTTDFLREAKDVLTQKFNLTIDAQSAVKSRMTAGFEFSVTHRSGRKWQVRAFSDGGARYLLFATPNKKDAESANAIRRVFDSFKIIKSGVEWREAKEQQLKDLTPDPLPQSSQLIRVSRDTLDEGLKGPVSILKTTNYDIYYDLQGDRTRIISYRDRELNNVIVYGVIDGARVTRGKSVSSDWRPVPEPGTLKNLNARTIPATPPYSSKHIYFYDERKRLREEQVLSSTGKFISRVERTYGENSVEIKTFNMLGLDERLVMAENQKLDENGNLIEDSLTYYHSVKPGEWGPFLIHRRAFTDQQFDEHGNWTSRSFVAQNFNLDGTPFEPKFPEYHGTEKRTIIYYK